MSETPKYLELLQRHRAQDARTWPEIAVAAGVKSRTSEPWIKGNVAEPPLVGIVRLAVELGVTPTELVEAVMEDASSGQIGLLEDVLARLERVEVRLGELPTREDLAPLLGRVREADAEQERRRGREGGAARPG